MEINIASLGVGHQSVSEKTISRNSLLIEVIKPTRGLTLLKDFLISGDHKTIFHDGGETFIIGNLKLCCHNISVLLVAGKVTIDLPLSNEKIRIHRMEDYVDNYHLLEDYI